MLDANNHQGKFGQDYIRALASAAGLLVCTPDLDYDGVDPAAKTVVEGPLPAFPGGTPPAVADLLQRVQLGPSRPGSYVLTVRVPLDGAAGSTANGAPAHQLLGRRVARRLYEAVSAVRSATARATDDDVAPFEEAVTAGVSANLCEALSGLAGRERRQPFDVAFRWGRGVASDVPAGTIHFATGAGTVIWAAATRLRQLGASGNGVVTGLVEGLYDQAQGTDRWRIKVRGNLTAPAGGGINHTVWVRLDGQRPYDRAIAALKSKQRVRAQGLLATQRGRAELVVSERDFTILD